MPYEVFASYYDRLLAGQVDYGERARYFDRLIRRRLAVTGDTILLDLACGTGGLSREFAALGYDVIGVDGSGEMLAEAASKGAEGILYLRQDFTALDLYGTVDVAVCALDSLNHITDEGALRAAIERVALFTAPGGLFLFDVNTEYKHREVLGNNTFVYDLDDLYCVWQNTTDGTLTTEVTLDFFLKKGDAYRREGESFCERAWSDALLRGLLAGAGYEVLSVYAGDTLDPVGDATQRAVYVARKR